MNNLLRLVLIAVASLTVAGKAMAAPSITTVEACVDGSGFQFVLEFTDTSSIDLVIFRIDAESAPFVIPTERISINYDTAGVVVFAQVETIGTPDFDRWQDGTIPPADFSVTDLGDGSWRIEGTVPNGTEPLVVDDEVAFFAVRTSFGTTLTTTFATNVPVAACAGAESSFVSEVNLDDGAPWSPNTPGDTIATNGEGVIVETGQLIDVTMTINLNGVDAWRCTEVSVADGIFISNSIDHADSTGAGPAFAGFSFDVPATGVYDLELTGFPNDDCTGTAIASITLLTGPIDVTPPAVAIIDPTASIGNNVTFAGVVTIEAGAIIGDRVALGDQVMIGPNTTVEADAVLDQGTIVGANSLIGAAANLTFVINGVFTPSIIGDAVIIGNNAQIIGAQIGNNTDIGAGVEIRSVINGLFAPASVGRNASIGNDSTVIGSIVRNGAVIGSDVEIRFVINGLFIPSIIGRDVAVGDGSLIEGTFIKTNATLAPGVSTGTGSEIGHRASIGAGSSFGSHTIVKRDTIVGDNVQAGDDLIIRTGVVVGSDNDIGNNVDLGKNSSVGNFVTIGNDVTVTPGASVPDGAVIPDGATFP